MNFLHNYFNEIVALVGLVVWLVRLEGKMRNVEEKAKSMEQLIHDNKKQLEEYDSKIFHKLSEIAERLSFIEGSLRANDERK